MSDPERLGLGDNLGATLLASARDDVPPSGARQRVKAALGAGVAVGLAATTTVKATSAATKGAVSGLWLKIAGGAIVTTTIATATIVHVTTDDVPGLVATPPTSVAPSAAPQRAAGPTTPEVPRELPSDPSWPNESAPSAAAPIRSPRPTVAAPARPLASVESRPSTLARELAMLDDARAAVASGDAAQAISTLDGFDRTFPSAALRTEASVLRAEALLAKGDRAAARKLAGDLLARDRGGPHAKRLATIAQSAE